MSRLSQLPGQTANVVDERFTIASLLRRAWNKVFPDHWSFLLGEIALYSFVILLLTGTYLALFFTPSQKQIVYHGSYLPLQNVKMSEAYASSLDISFDVRGGLVLRQIHHWAAVIFVAAITVHMLRVFFTGAFRKPREVNWLIGIVLLTLALGEGFAGYSLPDDLLSGTGFRIFDAVILSIPVVGTWMSYMMLGGEFPGTLFTERLYIGHVFLLPGLILGLIALHLAILIKQKHTQFPGPGRTERNVAGIRLMPSFTINTTAFFMTIFAVLALLGGLAQINPIWLYGPYDPSQVSAGSQPDWYIGFLEGTLRLFPAWEIRVGGYTVSAVLWPAVVLPGLMFTLAALYPFIEARLTKDYALHNLLQRPRDMPNRTALGAMAVTFYTVLWIAGGNDLIGKTFSLDINTFTWALRFILLLAPPLAYYVTYRLCLGLQQHDREVLEHGIETGIIQRLPSGRFIEIHQPLGEVDEHGHGTVAYEETPVPKRLNKLVSAGRAIRGFFSPVGEEPPAVETGEIAEKPRQLTRADD